MPYYITIGCCILPSLVNDEWIIFVFSPSLSPPLFFFSLSDRYVGWMSYIAIESYGSLAVAMFWAFTNSSIPLEGAKSLYGLILAGAQIGAIVGSTLAAGARTFSVPKLYIMGAFTPSVMAVLIYVYTLKFPKHLPAETPRTILAKKRLSTGLLEGLKVVVQYPYVAALAGISCLYEIVLTILDYQMKVGLGGSMIAESSVTSSPMAQTHTIKIHK